MLGIISAIRPEKRFGFIRGDDGLDRFFHQGSLERKQTATFKELEEGMRVSFESYELSQPAEPVPTDPTKQHNNLRARRVKVMS